MKATGFSGSSTAIAAAHVSLVHQDLLESSDSRRDIDQRYPLEGGTFDARVRSVYCVSDPNTSVSEELLRAAEATALYVQLQAFCEGIGITALKLLPPFVFETVSEVSVRRAANVRRRQRRVAATSAGADGAQAGAADAADSQPQCEFSDDLTMRYFLLPQDVGVDVVEAATGADAGTIVGVTYERGRGNVATLRSPSTGSEASSPPNATSASAAATGVTQAQRPRSANLSDLKPKAPIAINLDTFLPCGEIVPDGHCPASVRDIALSMIYEAAKPTQPGAAAAATTTAKEKQLLSWNVSEAATKYAAEARARFAVARAVVLRVGPAVRAPAVEISAAPGSENGERAMTHVSCGGLRHAVLTSHVAKLRSMYDGVCGAADPAGAAFPQRLFCLLTRYFSLAGARDGAAQEAAWHCAVPPAAMRVLHRRMDVSLESFASPLNAYSRRYCSAFPDTDCFFGSVGSFFEFRPSRGSFEACPPYDHQLMSVMFDHMIDLCATTSDAHNDAAPGGSGNSVPAAAPLSFFVVMPWSERPAAQKVLQRVRAAGLVRADEKLEGCAYVDGFQQSDADRGFLLRCPTRVVVVQNAAGAATWPCAEPLREFVSAWRVVSATTD